MSRPPEPEPRVEEALSDPAALGAALASLGPALELLERFHHRNKNQHRMSKWWAQADMLRRHVRKLLGELERAQEEAERLERRRRQRQRQRSAMAKAAEVKVKVEVKEKAEAGAEREGKKDEPVLPLAGGMMVAKRAEYLRARLGPGAFLAFTQLAADRQFAHLGLMLLGVLAQVDRAAAPFAPAARETSAAQQQQEAAAAAAMTTARATATGARSGGSGGAVAVAVETNRNGNAETDTAMDVDVGVAVSREEVMASIERDAGPRTSTSTPTPRLTSGSDHTDPAGKAHPRSASLPINTLPTHRISHSSETPTAKTEPASKESSTNPDPAAIKPKKKKAGKGDEFDDIFGGLDSNSKKPKKKKRKKGDEFDDIFSGL